MPVAVNSTRQTEEMSKPPRPSGSVKQGPLDSPGKDYLTVAAYNSDDGTWLVVANQDYEFTAPWAKVHKGGIRQTIRNVLSDVLGVEHRTANLILYLRCWQGNEETPITNVVFQVPVTNEMMKKKRNPEGGPKVMWKSTSDLAKTEFVSPEASLFFMSAQEREKTIKMFEMHSAVQGHSFVEILKENVVVTSQSVKDLQENLIIGVNWSESDQASVARHFMKYSAPFMMMGVKSFKHSMAGIQPYTDDNLVSLFRAGDMTGRGAMTIKEYLSILAFVEPVNMTQPSCIEAEAKYVFRYFDKQKRNIWSPGDLEQFLSEIAKKNKKVNVAVDKEVVKFLKDIDISGPEVSMAVFVKAVTSGKYKLPNLFLKGSAKVFDTISTQSGGGRGEKQEGGEAARPISGSQKGDKRPDIVVPSERKTYTFAFHIIRVGKNGYVDHSTMDKMAKCSSPSAVKNLVATKKSLMGFGDDNPANEVLMGLKFFASTVGTTEKGTKEPYTWEKVEYVTLGKLLIQLAAMAEEIFRTEPRLVYVSAPAIILGDIHGNYIDLNLFETALWPSGLHLSLGNVLFLGDYVDRGPHGAEVIAYLFATKVKNPNRLVLVRGNHEIRQVQRQFTFYNECIKKFGKDFGQEVWKAVNNSFDCMPLAAIVDNELFCCHGGVPPPWLCPTISVINNIPIPLSNPEAQSALAWELLWNDPLREESANDAAVATELNLNDGFAVNKRRGTAHMFSTAALSKFLKVNNLSYAIRAHEVVDCGFRIQQSSKLATIFSTSYYSGMTNKAACILVQDQKLRILNLMTDEFHKEERKAHQKQSGTS